MLSVHCKYRRLNLQCCHHIAKGSNNIKNVLDWIVNPILWRFVVLYIDRLLYTAIHHLFFIYVHAFFFKIFYLFLWKAELLRKGETERERSSIHWITPHGMDSTEAWSFFQDSHIGAVSQRFEASSTIYPGHKQGLGQEVE